MTTFTTSRTISATTNQVYAAFSNPEKLAKWWGPSGFRNIFVHFDFSNGGRWSFIMHGPNGANYPNECIFEEIEEPCRLVIRHVVEPLFRLTITLQDAGSCTAVLWEQAFDSDDVARAVENIVVPANEQNLDRLVSEVMSNS